VLVTGGAGYIGSHTVVDLLEQGYDVTIVDNLVNSSRACVQRVEQITGKSVAFHQADLTDKAALDKVFASEAKFDSVIHFAGLKAVGESVQKPLKYYQNNIMSTINLLEVMEAHGCKKLVFSSSATVYGDAPIPYSEESPAGHGITNPYGETKYMIEQILKSWYRSQGEEKSGWGIVILRYFNPIGAHPSGLIGEDPLGIPNNLMPYIAQVAVGRREYLTVFGDKYPTPDGTGVRDYLHVVDLAKGHTAALKWLETHDSKYEVFNLGTGKGMSVMEMIKAMERACGHPIPYKIGPPRAGDLPEFYSVPDKARNELGWATEKTIDDCCADTWRWQSKNPNGFAQSDSERSA
jgi:UDP-glucose 4-epimerase